MLRARRRASTREAKVTTAHCRVESTVIQQDTQRENIKKITRTSKLDRGPVGQPYVNLSLDFFRLATNGGTRRPNTEPSICAGESGRRRRRSVIRTSAGRSATGAPQSAMTAASLSGKFVRAFVMRLFCATITRALPSRSGVSHRGRAR